MQMIDKITETEKNMFMRYLESYAYSGGDCGEIKATFEHLLRFWNENKGRYLGRIFGDQLILQKELSYERSRAELEDQLDEKFYSYSARNSAPGRFYQDYIEWRSQFYDRDSNNREVYYALDALMSTDALINNRYDGETVSFMGPNGKEIKIPHGCRATRMIGKIAEAYGIKGFEDFRIAHSMVLNQKMLKGNLCISIHPLDYVTMSDNECDWSSCMSWKEDGYYRQGTVEMMNSPMVVVAYLTAADNMYMPGNNSWNNKKWRELYIVNDEIITNIKAYPYCNEELTKIVIKWLKELVTASDLGWKYDENPTAWRHDEQEYVERFKEKSIRIYPETEFMYNDFEANCQQWSYIAEELSGGTHYINYSGQCECMACGAATGNFDGEGRVVCEDCEEITYCDDCGDRIYGGDDTYYVDGQTICESCYDNHTFEDMLTGEAHMKYNGYEVAIAPDKDAPFEGCKLFYNNGWRDRGNRAVTAEDRGHTIYKAMSRHIYFYDETIDEAMERYSTAKKLHQVEGRYENRWIIYLSEVTEELATDLGYESLEDMKKEFYGSEEILIS